MRGKAILHALLYPWTAVAILLLPLSAVGLIYVGAFLGAESPLSIAVYVLSAYTLTVWCLRMPQTVRALRRFYKENPILRRLRADTRLRVALSLYAALLWNAAYGFLQLGLGIRHSSAWYYSVAAYYGMLALMRLSLARYTRRFLPGENIAAELRRYRACGFVLLLMNLALSAMIFYMVVWDRGARHHEITVIAMAAYTFATFAAAIVNILRYRRYNSPVYSASKAIGLASAAVSMLTLEGTMLTTWENGQSPAFRRIMLAMTGAAVVAFILALAVYMLKQSAGRLKHDIQENKEREAPASDGGEKYGA